MKIEKTQAWKSNNDCIWETEKEALDSNIDECIETLFDINRDVNYFSIKEWFKNNKKEIRYILANIDKF